MSLHLLLRQQRLFPPVSSTVVVSTRFTEIVTQLSYPLFFPQDVCIPIVSLLEYVIPKFTLRLTSLDAAGEKQHSPLASLWLPPLSFALSRDPSHADFHLNRVSRKSMSIFEHQGENRRDLRVIFYAFELPGLPAKLSVRVQVVFDGRRPYPVTMRMHCLCD